MNWYNDKIKNNKDCASLEVISDLGLLYPPFAFLVLRLFIQAYKNNLKICIYETYRSQERQLECFNKGASKLKSNGMHHFGVAADLVFRDEKNNPSWDEKHDWLALGKLGRELGLYWGGDWPGSWDKPHFQFIPAIDREQTRIIRGEYPEYESKTDEYLEKFLPYFNKLKVDNYSDAVVKQSVEFYDGVFNLLNKPLEKISIADDLMDNNIS